VPLGQLALARWFERRPSIRGPEVVAGSARALSLPGGGADCSSPFHLYSWLKFANFDTVSSPPPLPSPPSYLDVFQWSWHRPGRADPIHCTTTRLWCCVLCPPGALRRRTARGGSDPQIRSWSHLCGVLEWPWVCRLCISAMLVWWRISVSLRQHPWSGWVCWSSSGCVPARSWWPSPLCRWHQGSGLSVSSFLFDVPPPRNPMRQCGTILFLSHKPPPFLTPEDPERRRPLSCFVLPDFVLGVWVSLLDHLLFVAHLHPSASKHGVRWER
jgi:hypothetical protein